MPKLRPVALIWFRQDLRVHDNPALAEAMRRDMAVLPIFIWNPAADGRWPPGAAAKWWLHHSLASLELELRRRGAGLIAEQGEPLAALLLWARKVKAQVVYWNRRHEPGMREAEDRLGAELMRQGFEAQGFDGFLLHDPESTRTQTGRPFQVFTPFWKKFAATLKCGNPVPAPASCPGALKPFPSACLEALELLPRLSWAEGLAAAWRPGEAGAAQNLDRFVRQPLAQYGVQRDFMADPGTSRLSPHLHFGEVSPRQVWQAVASAKPVGAREVFLRQLGWREFAWHLLHHFSYTPEEPLRPAFRRFPWVRDEARLRAWQKGQTGYPVVDAGLRELWATGWMHNRARMIVASFLVKDLRLDWLAGARWFWDTLVDADLGNNTLGWQWSAGCGADAAPYFRIFNPVAQGRRFDPDGAYVRRWVPELAALPARWVHEPWNAPAEVLQQAQVRLGREYPPPIVEHAVARRQALDAFKSIKSG